MCGLVRRLFGWTDVPDPTTFGRWLRRAGASLLPVVNRLLRHLVRLRWEWSGVPKRITLALDSTVVVSHGRKQADAPLSVEGRRPLENAEGTLDLDTYEVSNTAHVLTNIPGIMPGRWTHHAEQWTRSLTGHA